MENSQSKISMYYIKYISSNWLGTTFTTMLQKRSNNNLTVRPFLMPESHYVKAEINKSLRNITMASTAWKTICTSMCLKSPHSYSSLRVFILSCSAPIKNQQLCIMEPLSYFIILSNMKKIDLDFALFTQQPPLTSATSKFTWPLF